MRVNSPVGAEYVRSCYEFVSFVNFPVFVFNCISVNSGFLLRMNALCAYFKGEVCIKVGLT